jgi:predicted ArsR family transcriptional regulator
VKIVGDDSVSEFAEKKVLKLGSDVTKIVKDDAADHILKKLSRYIRRFTKLGVFKC